LHTGHVVGLTVHDSDDPTDVATATRCQVAGRLSSDGETWVTRWGGSRRRQCCGRGFI